MLADAANLLHMHPQNVQREMARLAEQGRLPPVVEFRALQDDDWLSLRLLVDDDGELTSAFAGRNADQRVRQALAVVGPEVVGYFGLDRVNELLQTPSLAPFVITDGVDRRQPFIRDAIRAHLADWLAELTVHQGAAPERASQPAPKPVAVGGELSEGPARSAAVPATAAGARATYPTP